MTLSSIRSLELIAILLGFEARATRMTKIIRSASGYKVVKNALHVASIRKANLDEQSDNGNWILESMRGRIDRHHYFEDAKSDALKI